MSDITVIIRDAMDCVDKIRTPGGIAGTIREGLVTLERELHEARAEIKRLRAAPRNTTDELDFCYLSIASLKSQVSRLEHENAVLSRQINEPHPASNDWTGDGNSEYHRGIGGGPGY